jgi:hypothetical protein
VTALEFLAGDFCCLLIEAGEACSVEQFVTSLHTFGERVGRSKNCASLELCFAKMLPCLGLAVEGADLNQPSRRHVGLLNGAFDRYIFRFGGFGHSWHGGSDDRTRPREQRR